MFENIEKKAIAEIFNIEHYYPEFANLQTLDILDIEIFQQLRDSIDDDLVFSDLVTVYLSSAEDLIEKIKSAFTRHDAKSFSIASHSLKSTSASIGAMRLSQICRYFEKISKTGEIPISSEVLNILLSEYEKVPTAIQARVIEFMTE